MPEGLIKTLTNFRRLGNSQGTLLVRNVPIDRELPPTPSVPNSVATECTTCVAALLLVMTRLGDPISFSEEKNENDAIPGGVEIVGDTDIDSILSADPEWLTSIDATRKTEIEGGVGRLLACEGSHGSEGFFARVDEKNNPLWVVYLEESNPFVNISLNGNEATFQSSSGVSVTVDTNYPESGVTGQR